KKSLCEVLEATQIRKSNRTARSACTEFLHPEGQQGPTTERSHATLLALLPAQQSDFSRHRAWSFTHSCSLRAAQAGLDEGTFTEGHELDRKCRDRPHPHGRLRCGFS